MPPKVKEDTPFTASGRIISVRTSVALDAAIDEFIEEVSARELKQLDRAEAARRLIVAGLNEWKKHKPA